MAIEPSEFLKVAEAIADNCNASEALIRTAIGRAYYGAFLSCESFLSKGYGIKRAPSEDGKNKGIHADVIYTLTTHSHSKLRSFGLKLKQARDARVVSDYKPQNNLSHDDLLDTIDHCRYIVDAITLLTH